MKSHAVTGNPHLAPTATSRRARSPARPSGTADRFRRAGRATLHRAIPLVVAVVAGLVLSACGRHRSGDQLVVTDPKAAATGLEASFEQAPTAVRENVRLASEAMRQAQYEQAILSLTAVREQPNVTVEQGLAIHGAVVSLESQLVAAMQAGDPNAKRAYALLRAMKRN